MAVKEGKGKEFIGCERLVFLGMNANHPSGRLYED